MKEGWWVNYETRRYILLKCVGMDHEATIRVPANQKWLGLPTAVIKGITRFRPVLDRDALLLHLMRKAPLMRIRGHGTYVTFEFCSVEEDMPLNTIRRWAKKNGSPETVLKVSNLETLKGVSLTVADLNRLLRRKRALASVSCGQIGNVGVDRRRIGQ